jgi:hypothetical protein
MPCYRCGARQLDPVRGPSPWQRGVRGNQQVLVCPACQADPALAAELDRCRHCGSVRLARRLGEVECRACGFVHPPEGTPGSDAAPGPAAAPAAGGTASAAPGLAEEVDRALERVFGRNTRALPCP